MSTPHDYLFRSDSHVWSLYEHKNDIGLVCYDCQEHQANYIVRPIAPQWATGPNGAPLGFLCNECVQVTINNQIEPYERFYRTNAQQWHTTPAELRHQITFWDPVGGEDLLTEYAVREVIQYDWIDVGEWGEGIWLCHYLADDGLPRTAAMELLNIVPA